MQNVVRILYKGNPLITILVHKIEFLSMNQVLEKYAKYSGFNKKDLTGYWEQVIDITSVSREIFAENDWDE